MVSKKIVVKVWGGLGNQLFQYAFGYAYSKKYNRELLLDVDFFERRQPKYVGRRKFQLDKFTLDGYSFYSRTGKIKILESFFINRLIQRLKMVNVKIENNIRFIKEKTKTYEEVCQYGENIIYFDGYWQSEAYFKDIKKELYNLLVPKTALPQSVSVMMKQIRNCESVAIHIRRGDFTKGKKIKIGCEVPLEYYYKALMYMKDNLDNPVFFFFSDDMEWVKSTFGENTNYRYVIFNENDAEIYDLLCMMKCKNNIMSASTFSWWGAWLKDSNQNGIVVAPQGNYFNNKFLLDEWVKL